jgi:hypothetical protein
MASVALWKRQTTNKEAMQRLEEMENKSSSQKDTRRKQ